MGHATELPDFVRVERDAKVALVHPDFRDTVAAALLEGEGCGPADEAGRAPLKRFSYSEGTGLIREYRRGGFVRHFMTKSYLFDNRPLHEIEVHCAAYRSGVAVPMPLGAYWERRGPIYRGAIAVARIEAVHLLDYLSRGGEGKEEALQRCGAALRQMHDAGFIHADLQIRNILMADEGPYIIDLDKARQRTRVSPSAREINLVRLRRSFKKNHVPLKHFDTIRAGYQRDS